jgi:hypothetical protein
MGRNRKRKTITLAPTAACAGIEIEHVVVQDPYEPEKPRLVAKNIRTHPLDQMLARGRLSETQKAAGDRFLALWDRSQIGGTRAIDYTRVKVDESRTFRDLDDRALAAARELERVRLSLGQRAYALLAQVIGERKGFWDLARRPDGKVERAHAEHLAWSFRDAIDDLIDFFGVARGKVRTTPPYERAVRPFTGKIELEQLGEEDV